MSDTTIPDIRKFTIRMVWMCASCGQELDHESSSLTNFGHLVNCPNQVTSPLIPIRIENDVQEIRKDVEDKGPAVS
jgi:hypothetical protein